MAGQEVDVYSTGHTRCMVIVIAGHRVQHKLTSASGCWRVIQNAPEVNRIGCRGLFATTKEHVGR